MEHLLRDIRDVAVGTLSTRVTNQIQSLQGLHLRLRDIQEYLQKVLDGQLPVNHAILGNLQDVFNLLPNLSTPSSKLGAPGAKVEAGLPYAMSVKTNDQLMTIYLSSLIRAITAFHDLIENKIQNRQQQEERDGEASPGKDGDKNDGADKASNGGNSDKEDKDKDQSKEKK